MGTYENNRKNAKFVGLMLRNTTDADIIEALDAHANKQAFIKACIRAFIASPSAISEIVNDKPGKQPE